MKLNVVIFLFQIRLIFFSKYPMYISSKLIFCCSREIWVFLNMAAYILPNIIIFNYRYKRPALKIHAMIYAVLE